MSENNNNAAEQPAVVEQQPTHDVANVQAAVDRQQGDVPTQPEFREITIRVPVQIPDQMIKAAWDMGTSIVQAAQHNVLTCVFPHAVPDPKNPGQAISMLGKVEVPLGSGEDIQRIVSLCQKIRKINIETMQKLSTGNALEAATAQVTAEKLKDNAAVDANARAEGRIGGIITP